MGSQITQRARVQFFKVTFADNLPEVVQGACAGRTANGLAKDAFLALAQVFKRRDNIAQLDLGCRATKHKAAATTPSRIQNASPHKLLKDLRKIVLRNAEALGQFGGEHRLVCGTGRDFNRRPDGIVGGLREHGPKASGPARILNRPPGYPQASRQQVFSGYKTDIRILISYT